MLVNPLGCPSAIATRRQRRATITSCISSCCCYYINLSSSVSFSLKHQHRRRYSAAAAAAAAALKVSCGMKVKVPLKVMLTGGKTSVSQFIVQQFGLLHISTGDLLRAEVAAQTDIGLKAQHYFSSGRLLPHHFLTAMVRARLSLQDAQENGWLLHLDAYPTTSPQPQDLSLDQFGIGITPDIFLALQVPDHILINITNFPDDTLISVTSRPEIYKRNVEAVLALYADVVKKEHEKRKVQFLVELGPTMGQSIKVKYKRRIDFTVHGLTQEKRRLEVQDAYRRLQVKRRPSSLVKRIGELEFPWNSGT